MVRLFDCILLWLTRLGADEDDWEPNWDADDWRWENEKGEK